MQEIENLIYIPCKSRSTRLLNKNFLKFNNEKLFERTIKQAKKLNLDKYVLIDSDSTKILNRAKKLGINIYKRKIKNSKDSSTLSECLMDALVDLKKNGKSFKNIIILQVTSPLRRIEDIYGAYKLLKKNKANSIISMCKTFSPVQWANTLNNKFEINNFLKNSHLKVRSQDLKNYYQINGAIYIVKLPIFIKYKRTLNLQKSFAYIMSRMSSIDIDDEFDFMLAKQIFKIKNYHLFD